MLAWADDSGTTGSCTWMFTESTGTLTISGEGYMGDYGDNTSQPWNAYKSKIKTAVIEEGVTGIGYNAFYGCSRMTSVTIPETVISISHYAFQNCSSLTSITIPESVTSIGSSAFQDCTGLTSVMIPAGVTYISDHAFSGCSSLISVNIPDGVTSIGDCTFSNCSNLTSITIPESVISIGSNTFSWCKKLKYTNIPSGLKYLGSGAFSQCASLTTDLIIAEGITSIDDFTFDGVGPIRITIPESVCSINGYFVFRDCPAVLDFKSSMPIPQPSLNNSMIIIVPDEAVAAYKEAWPKFQNNIIGKSGDNLKVIEASAKENTSDLAEQIGENNLLGVSKLKLSGTINSYDMMIIRNKMINLQELDMQDVDIVANSYEYYSGYHSEDSVFGGSFLRETKVRKVILPSSIKSIEQGAFYNCRMIRSVTIPEGVVSIGNQAFQNCSALQSVETPTTLETIGRYAFQNCYQLQNISLQSGLKNIYGYAFSGCESLTSITITEGVTGLNYGVFSGCYNLSEIKMSPKTTTIGGYALQSCSFSEIKLPPYLTSIGNYAFSGCSNLKDIYAYMVDVPAINTYTFNDYQHQNLYVPEFLYNSYFYDTNWSQFLTVNVCDLKPGDYEAFYANSDVYFEPGVERITEDTPEVELGEHGGIIVEGEEQHFGDVHQGADGDGDSSSLIADGEDDGSNNNMPINKLFVDIKVRANRWYFFCFPFDVTISDCDYPGKYVWRLYDGVVRAQQGSGGWQPVEGDKLEARRGYIFQSSAAGTLTVKFDHPTFGGDRPKELEVHACDNAANASWNFVGNPYSSYYDFQEEDFTSPITVWNGSSYEAYRPGDDEYHLQPYEAFFVQKPEAAEQINFEPERRETYWQIQKKAANGVKARQAKGINPDRLILNLTAGAVDSGQSDRMRLVLNEQASRGYELECDAAKFLSSEAPVQLYSVEGENTMAINERPMDGDIRLGYVAKTAGTFRISAPRMDIPMMLVDNETGTTFDLSLGDYEFQAAAGTNNQRFLLKPSGETTAIRTLTKDTGVAVGLQEGGLSIGGAEDKTVSIHTTSGALAAQHSGNGFVSLPGGMYVVSVDGKSAKIYVK